jgi:hypothetical protein
MDDPRYLGSSGASFDWASVNWWGLFIVVLGVAWLGDNMKWWHFEWSMVGPIALVFAGVMMTFQSQRRRSA